MEEAPVLARDERRRTVHNLIQIIVDFMIGTLEF